MDMQCNVSAVAATWTGSVITACSVPHGGGVRDRAELFAPCVVRSHFSRSPSDRLLRARSAESQTPTMCKAHTSKFQSPFLCNGSNFAHKVFPTPVQRRIIMGLMDSSRHNMHHNHFMWSMMWRPRASEPDPLIGCKWMKDRSEEKSKPANIHYVPGRPLVWRPEKLVLFDNIKKAHKARVRAAAIADPGLTWEQVASRAKLNAKYLKLPTSCRTF